MLCPHFDSLVRVGVIKTKLSGCGNGNDRKESNREVRIFA